MPPLSTCLKLACAALFATALPTAAHASLVNVTVTATNLLRGNSNALAPVRFGIGNGTFDAFNNGQTAAPGIVSIAEGGSGSAWFPAFAAAEPRAVLGSAGGLLLPGGTGSVTVAVDTAIDTFFTFAAMVVPSNDFFLGNDSPTAFKLLDAGGNLLINSITQNASDIWDAGSETFDPAAAAFLLIGNNDLRTAQNGVVNKNFAELARFDGLTTAANYQLTSGLAADTNVLRITFAVTPVPEPPAALIVGAALLALGGMTLRTKRGQSGFGAGGVG